MAEKVARLGVRYTGVDLDVTKSMAEVELFGHVTLVEGYALPSFTGCHALVSLRDTPGEIVAVLTSEQRLQGSS